MKWLERFLLQHIDRLPPHIENHSFVCGKPAIFKIVQDDIIVLEYSGVLSQEASNRLKDSVQNIFKVKHVAILEEGMKLTQVIKQVCDKEEMGFTTA